MIVGIIGTIGSGKTILMTQHLFLDMLSGVNVLANYNLFFPHTQLDKIKDLDDVPDQRNVLGIDEPYTSGLDSRESQSKKNRVMSKHILQCRKKKMDVYITSQFLSAIELRARGLIDLIYYPEIVSYDEQGRPQAIRVMVHKMKNYNEACAWTYSSYYMPLSIGSVYAGDLYNTYEIVEGMESAETGEFDEKVREYMQKAQTGLNKTKLASFIYGHERKAHKNPITKAFANEVAQYCILVRDGDAD